MKKVFNIMANLLVMLTVFETSTASTFFIYQPELPKKN